MPTVSLMQLYHGVQNGQEPPPPPPSFSEILDPPMSLIESKEQDSILIFFCFGQIRILLEKIVLVISFSNRNDSSWHRVNPTFMENYRPRHCLDGSEFWIPFIEFCRHFGHLVICSSTQPYKGFDCSDCSPCQKEDTPVTEGYDNDCLMSVDLSIHRSTQVGLGGNKSSTEGLQTNLETSLHYYQHQERVGSGSIGITVQENPDTVKVDTTVDQEEGATLFVRRTGGGRLQQQGGGGKRDSVTTITSTRSRQSSGDSMTITAVSVHGRPSYSQQGDRRGSDSTWGSHSSSENSGPTSTTTTSTTTTTNITTSQVGTKVTSTTTPTTSYTTTATSTTSVRRNESVTSNLSSISNTSLSDTESTNSASQVKIRLKSSSSSHRHYADRPSSAPAKSPNHSRGTRKSLSMFDARMDYFRSQGSWRTVVRYFGRWESESSIFF